MMTVSVQIDPAAFFPMPTPLGTPQRGFGLSMLQMSNPAPTAGPPPIPFALRDWNIVCTGSSLTNGAFTSYPVFNQLSLQLNAGGKVATVFNGGHNGFTVKYPNMVGTTFALIGAEVDANYVADPNVANILIIEGFVNDLKYGATPAQCVQYVKDYVDACANTWDCVLVVIPSKRTDVGTLPAYEVRRLALIGLIAGDPTFGGRVNGIVHLGDDPRLADTTDLFWFNPDLVHYTDYTNAIWSSMVIREIRAIFSGPSYTPIWAPWPDPFLNAASGCLNGAGNPCSDGEAIATWEPAFAWTTGDFVQANPAARPTYSAAGFGGAPCVQGNGAPFLQSVNACVNEVRYTFMGKVDATNVGAANTGLLFLQAGNVDVRLYICENIVPAPPNTIAVYDYVSSLGLGSIKFIDAPPGIITGAPHVVMTQSDGTDANHIMLCDGAPVALTTFAPFNNDLPYINNSSNRYIMGTGGNGLVGKCAMFFASPIPLNEDEYTELYNYFAA